MKPQHMYKYFTSLLLVLLISTSAIAQDKKLPSQDGVKKDSINLNPKRYGLRLGVDLIRVAKPFLDDDFEVGFEINADYRIKKNLFISGEIGIDERTTETDFLSSTASGSYIKAGVDINLFNNWPGLDNLIYTGFRLGYSTFDQTINSFTIFNTDQTFPSTQSTETTEFDGLDAIWGEFIFGAKAEVLPNLYLGINVQFKILLNETEPGNFENLYIPGYNRTFDTGAFGFGLGYNISYLIPFRKK